MRCIEPPRSKCGADKGHCTTQLRQQSTAFARLHTDSYAEPKLLPLTVMALQETFC